MVYGGTNGRWSTDFVKVTWVYTMMLYTGLVICTIFVDVTLYCFTMNVGVSDKSLRTFTRGSVISSGTDSVRSTRILY